MVWICYGDFYENLNRLNSDSEDWILITSSPTYRVRISHFRFPIAHLFTTNSLACNDNSLRIYQIKVPSSPDGKKGVVKSFGIGKTLNVTAGERRLIELIWTERIGIEERKTVRKGRLPLNEEIHDSELETQES